MTNIPLNITRVRQQIQQVTLDNQRKPDAVTLLAVSKHHSVSTIETAIKAGLTQFGENYVQEGVEKILYFQQSALNPSLTWHFIGPIQSNKTKLIAQYFDWVQSIDRLKIAERLNAQRSTAQPPLNVLIQVNISQSNTKSGVMLDEILPLATAINNLPQLQLRGLMAIPDHPVSQAKQLELFEQMQHAFLVLAKHFPCVDTLSMGMSADITAAIQAGSTMLRIGTALFGSRNT